MSKQILHFVDGLYSAFNFSGKRTKITHRAKKTSYYTSNISTNSNVNIIKSIARVSISIEEATK